MANGLLTSFTCELPFREEDSRQMKSLTHFAVCSLLTIPLFAVGCGDDQGRLTASGTVTLADLPLGQGSVVFVGEDGGSAGIGMITEGKFTLSEAGNSEGIQPGTYSVVVNAWIVEPGSIDDNGDIVDEGESLIPERYNDAKTSGLTATVSSDSTVFEFALLAE